MKTTENTILITGGGSGIGYEIAQLFSANGNQVIITGRTEEKLLKAASSLQNTTAIVADINNEDDVTKLVGQLKADFPKLNVVINNAGSAYAYDLLTPEINAFEKARDEMNTNFLSPIRLTEQLLPLLKEQKEAAIVNVSSVVAFTPSVKISTYSASKAALHSYTQSLRLSLNDTAVRVFELMPPLVNTEFSKEIGGENGIHPEVLAADLFKAFEENNFEIHTGQTADIYSLFLSSPESALLAMNTSH